MKIALDWDGTYTADPKFWHNFVLMCGCFGHEVRIVTMRTPAMVDEALSHIGEKVPIIFTSSAQKREFCVSIGWMPDIWIDDSPEFIVSRDVYKYLEVFNPENPDA